MMCLVAKEVNNGNHLPLSLSFACAFYFYRSATQPTAVSIALSCPRILSFVVDFCPSPLFIFIWLWAKLSNTPNHPNLISITITPFVSCLVQKASICVTVDSGYSLVSSRFVTFKKSFRNDEPSTMRRHFSPSNVFQEHCSCYPRDLPIWSSMLAPTFGMAITSVQWRPTKGKTWHDPHPYPNPNPNPLQFILVKYW